jgi:hypothetical protein
MRCRVRMWMRRTREARWILAELSHLLYASSVQDASSKSSKIILGRSRKAALEKASEKEIRGPLKGIMSPVEYILKSYKIKSILSSVS